MEPVRGVALPDRALILADQEPVEIAIAPPRFWQILQLLVHDWLLSVQSGSRG
jgi:hypothetical protein